MKLLKLHTFFFLLFSVSLTFGQTSKIYKEIDSLIATNSMIDAMTALNKLKENCAKDTVDAEYWLRYSKANYTFYKYEAAKAGINKALKLSPSNAKYHFEQGLLYNKISETDSALAPLETATSLDPGKGEYFYWKGIVNQQLKNNAAAEKDYIKAMENKFETAEMYNNFAILLIENQKPEKALEMINKAVALNDKYPQALSARSKINMFLLNFDAACADRKAANDMGYRRTFDIPDSICNGTKTQQLQFAAEVSALNSLYALAVSTYTKLIDNKVLRSDNFLNRGYCYYKLKDYANAEKDYLQAETLPGAALDLLYDNLSLLYFDQNNFKKSIEYSTKRIELNPKNHVPYIDRGLCYRKLKKYKEAEADFNKSLEIKPDFFRAFGYRSYLYLELGKNQKAYEDALKSVEINPKYGYGYVVLAQAKHRLGIPDFCIDLYKAKQYGEPEYAEEGMKELCK